MVVAALGMRPITARLSQLGQQLCPTGVSRTSIRLKSKAKQKRPRIEPSFAPGHGEQIFVYHHILDGLTVYSHTRALNHNRALRQIPFNGKKLRPARLRKDYWRPLALVQFPPGAGEVGRSVYQRLRECRRLHELSWDYAGREARDPSTGATRTRHERGRQLNDQRANAVADLAAVLAGLGKGNKIRAALSGLPDPDAAAAAESTSAEQPASSVSTASSAGTDAAAAAETTTTSDARQGTAAGGEAEAEAAKAGVDADADKPELRLPAPEGAEELVPVHLWWADELDRNYARDWSYNVRHRLFSEQQKRDIEAQQPEPEPEGEEAAVVAA
ncbi:transcriptional regulation of mitochondrial recombination-domain-containing protein [Xylariaceae sp. FL0804]|nr:transcriptional regulation of mitochondrial recombination-domain-containing protein [Xylariaceae sp. FL0804]